MSLTAHQEMAGDVITRHFHERSARVPKGPIDPEAQAALRQFSVERMMGYGVNYADALELRGRVTTGEAWQAAAADLAALCLAPAEDAVAPASPATNANRLYRASALLRMSQIRMSADDDNRREIFARAAALYRQAAVLTRDRRQIIIETPQGPLAGWFYPRQSETSAGCAVVIGGIEAWAMDFSAQGMALARRGVDALVLDGPGQGESRLAHRHYLTQTWLQSYQAVFDDLAKLTNNAPMALVGNSMGGAIALRLASQDARVAACCDNCGPLPGRAPPSGRMPGKILAHCGDVTEAAAAAIWRTVNPAAPDASVNCPLLIVHGGLDPLVSITDATQIFKWAKSTDKQMVIYSDGDHCVYNHAEDLHNLIADWVAGRLVSRKN